MDGRRDIKDLVGEVIDTERSTSRRNSIVQSERCGAHAEATSEASRSATRFLPTDINQLSRVTNERRIGTKLFHGPPYCIYTRVYTRLETLYQILATNNFVKFLRGRYIIFPCTENKNIIKS